MRRCRATPALWLAALLLVGFSAPALSSPDVQDGDLSRFLGDNSRFYAWLPFALERLGEPAGNGTARTFLLPAPTTATNESSAALLSAVAKIPLDRLRAGLLSYVLPTALRTADALVSAGEVGTLGGSTIAFAQVEGQLVAEVHGPNNSFSRVLNLIPVAIPAGESVVYLFSPPAAPLAATAPGRHLAEEPAAVVGDSYYADTRFCIKVRFGLPGGVRLIASDVDSGDWKGDRRPDTRIGDRLVMPGPEWCTPLNTNGYRNPRFTVSLGTPAQGTQERWESYRMEMDTWFLRSFAVTLWNAVATYLTDKIHVDFSDAVPWTVNRGESYDAFGGHVTVRWEDGLFQ